MPSLNFLTQSSEKQEGKSVDDYSFDHHFKVVCWVSVGVGVDGDAVYKLLLPALCFKKLMIKNSGQLVSSDRDNFNTFYLRRRTHPPAFIDK